MIPPKAAQAAKEVKRLTKDLTRQQVKKGNVTFQIERLTPMEGYELLDKLRNMIGEVVAQSWEQSPQAFIISALSRLPHENLEYVRKELFERIQFSRPDTAMQPRPLAGSEDIAFEGLDPGTVYEMVVRAFAVNFTDILQRVQSALEAAEKSSKQSPQTQSQGSLQPQSQPDTSSTEQSTTIDTTSQIS